MIEHFQTFYRFKIETQISIGKVFGLFETHKIELKIASYSVKQATIEQIFNLFAEKKIQVGDYTSPEDESPDLRTHQQQ